MDRLTVNLEHCRVNGVKADLVKGVARITIEASLGESLLEQKRILQLMAIDQTAVSIEVVEEQQDFPELRTFRMGAPEGAK